MDLIYLWVDKFRSFEHQGFTLTGEFRFEIEQVEIVPNFSEYRLTVSRSHTYCNIFPDSIRSVTGIVGRNGSGKSTLLHCLKMWYGMPARLAAATIMCFFDRHTSTIHTFYYNSGGTNLHSLNVDTYKKDDEDDSFNLENGVPFIIDKYSGNYGKVVGINSRFLEDVHCAYLSNTFDQHNEEIYYGIQNLSTNSLIDKFISVEIDRQIRERAQKKDNNNHLKEIDLFPTNLYRYRRKELEHWIRFLAFANSRRQDIPSFIPKMVHIQFNFSAVGELEKTGKPSWSPNKIIEKYLPVAEEGYQHPQRERFLLQTYLCMIFYFIRQTSNNKNRKRDKFVNEVIQRLIKGSSEHPDTLKDIISFIMKSSQSDILNYKLSLLTDDKLESALEDIDFTNVDRTNNIIHYEFAINSQLLHLLQLIFDLNYGDDSPIMNFSFGHGLSTGEEALLTNYAKLFQIRTTAEGKK